MKILHLMLSNFFIDGVSYQENILPLQNLKDGHDVKIIASTETYIQPNKLGYVEPSRYTNVDGLEITRIPYRRILPHFFMIKIRSYPNVYEMIEEFEPDVILHHGVPSCELLTIAKYKKNHPNIKLYLDSHEDFHNSAQGFISREVLHRRFYGPIVRKALPYVDKILCVSTECFDFLEKLYKVPLKKMEFYPLGGIVFSEEEFLARRKKIRQIEGLSNKDILMVHTGKMEKAKRTEELLKAFTQVESKNFKLIIIGSFSDDIELAVKPIIEADSRIQYIGWKDAEEVFDYLCAADIYLQPGSQSATMQNAICCGCAVMLYPYKSHKQYLKENGFFVETVEDMVNVFKTIDRNPEILKGMIKASHKVAYDLLDYRKLAARLYE